MDRDEALKLLRSGRHGIDEWNQRRANGEEIPLLDGVDLSHAALSGVDLGSAQLRSADLGGANLSRTSFCNAQLFGVDFRGTDFTDSDFCRANLTAADLTNSTGANAKLRRAVLHNAILVGARLNGVDLTDADLSGARLDDAKLSDAKLHFANFHRAKLTNADISGAAMAATSLADVDLSTAKGLAEVKHFRSSTLGTDTLYRSMGKIPQEFLEGCGVADSLITYLPSLLGQPLEFYSCFISHSTADKEFCDRLHSRMREEHLRVWYAPEDMKSGQKVHEQIDQAIRVNDKLLLVLSEESMKSNWVKTEIRHARQREEKEGKRVLFPIRVVPFEAIQEWTLPDGDTGLDSAAEIREYFIPDFSNWKDHDSFEEAFARLLKDLSADDADTELT